MSEDAQEDLEELTGVVSLTPDGADPREVVERKVPGDILEKYEVYSYKNAAVILAETRQTEFAEICNALRGFTVTKAMLEAFGDETFVRGTARQSLYQLVAANSSLERALGRKPVVLSKLWIF